MNNSSLLTADRMTHLKIVVVSLVCATLVAGVGVASRVSGDGATLDSNGRMEATVIKIGKPVTASTTESSTVR
jgi:Na+-transporting NADH:ubiquinone oxidoreductase subunit NqrC